MYVHVNGVRLFFDVVGEKLATDGPRMRERPTLVLLHGGPGFDHTMFKPAFAALADTAQIVMLDHRGNGRSDRGDPALWNLPQWGDDVAAFCDALGIEKPVVLGFSFGGFVAQSYATRHPQHPSRLILYSTASRLEDAPVLNAFEAIGGPSVRAVAAAYFAHRTPETTEAFRSVCFPLYNTIPPDPDARQRPIVNNDVSIRFFEGEGKTFDFAPALARIACPTLVVAGAADPRTPPAFARRIAAAIRPDLVRYEEFADCGHGPHVEQPERTMALLRSFIA
jgi:proline iminopeptidase